MRTFRAAASAVCWLLAAAISFTAEAQVPSRPNIIVLMADDAGYADFGFMSQHLGRTTEFKTPNLDSLASQSVFATQAYVAASQCAISRAGLMTGLIPERYGFSYNALPEDRPNESFPTEQLLVSERLKQLNYKTAAMGKWHLGDQEKWQPQNQGFDDFYGFFESGRYYFQTPGDVAMRRGTTPIAWETEASFNNVAPDPVLGRYMTDAIGDEASKYIAQNAGGADPFFLYVPFYGPHSPYQAKQQDLAVFNGTSLTGNRKNVAAMTYALDRNIGNILARVNDPNGDGNTSDSIADETMIVFLNDNGGPQTGDNAYDNSPLAGFKGAGYEGSLRTPMLIKAPGLAPGQFTKAVTALDFFPTFVAAAGGQMTGPTDGVNLLPFLTGAQTGEVHESIVNRNRVNYAFIRQGEYKLTRNNFNEEWQLYKLNPDGTGETAPLNKADYPELVAKMVRDYVAYDVQFSKPLNSTSAKIHDWDVWTRRNDVFVNANWAFSQGWYIGDTTTPISIARDDTSANSVFVFTPDNTQNYRSTNVRNRASGIPWNLLDAGKQDIPGLGEIILNEIRFQGQATAGFTATVDGKALIFANSLSGKAPGLRLDATQTGGSGYTFALNLDMILYNDVVIEGNGTTNFSIGGVIRDFWDPRSVTKKGTSTLTLAARNTYRGDTNIQGGVIRLAAVAAQIDGSRKVTIEAGGRLQMSNGSVITDQLVVQPGGVFDFTGGTLKTSAITGNILNGGSLVVAPPRASSTPGDELALAGNYSQTAPGVLSIDVFSNGTPGVDFDMLAIAGSATLGGTLLISAPTPAGFKLGDTMRVVTAAGGLTGTFANVIGPALNSGLAWSVAYNSTGAYLQVTNSSGTLDYLTKWRLSAGINNGADLDGDGDTDGNDFLLFQRGAGNTSAVVGYLATWRTSFGVDGEADLDGDGDTDGHDLLKWQRGAPQQPTLGAVPEPATLAMALAATAALLGARRKRA